MKTWLVESEFSGVIKKQFYRLMRLIFKFSPWHITPINERPYALEVYKTLNNYIEKSEFPHAPIVEVGCGLGEIIGNLKWAHGKIGFDRCFKVLKAARLLHPSVTFYRGTFKNVKCCEIRYLIMVNFIHMIPPNELKRGIEQILENNKVEMFVLDTFRDNNGTEYHYSHDGNYLFDGKYKLIKRSQSFLAAHGAKRYIEYWQSK